MSRYRYFTIEMPAPYEAFVMGATTRSKARAEAFSRFREVDEDLTFIAFARRVRVTPCATPGSDGYDYVRRNYGLDVTIGQRVRLKNEGAISGSEGEVIYPGPSASHVHVLLDGRQSPSWVHPFSIEAIA